MTVSLTATTTDEKSRGNFLVNFQFVDLIRFTLGQSEIQLIRLVSSNRPNCLKLFNYLLSMIIN